MTLPEEPQNLSREEWDEIRDTLTRYEGALRRISVCAQNPDPFGYLAAIATEALGDVLKNAKKINMGRKASESNRTPRHGER